MIKTVSGETVKITEAVLLPRWADVTMIQPLISVVPSYNHPVLESDDTYRKIYRLFDCAQPSIEEMILILEDPNLVNQLSAESSLSLFLSCTEHLKNENDHSVGLLFIKTFSGETAKIGDVTHNTKYIEYLFEKADGFIDRATIQWLKTELGLTAQPESPVTAMLNRRKKVVPRWRTAEQLCAEIEKGKGNIVKDVSEQNIGYDIVSISPSGKMSYIEVKSLKVPGEPFVMTNNEYTTAHQYGKDYFLCLVTQTDPPAVLYIEDPLNAEAHIEKRVRMWEWVYSDYSGNFEMSDI